MNSEKTKHRQMLDRETSFKTCFEELSVLQGLPAFHRSGVLRDVSAFLSPRSTHGVGRVSFGAAGRAAVGVCVGRRATKAADGEAFGSRGLTAPLRASAF